MTHFTIKAPAAPLARGETWYVFAHLAPDTPPAIAAVCNTAGWASRVKTGLELVEAARRKPATRPARRLRQAST